MNLSLRLAIVRCLTVGGESVERIRALRAFDDRGWRRTVAWLDDSGLALELLGAMDRVNASDAIPHWVAESLRVRLRENRNRLERMKQEFALINGALDRAGVDYAVLKGFSLVLAYTPDASLRTQYDYDYLVHPASFATATKVIESAGLRAKSQSPGRDPDGATSFVAGPLDCSAAGAEWYSVRIPRRVELHTNLWEYEREAVRVEAPEDVLKHKQCARWEGLSFPVLAAEDSLIFQCLHAFHHVLDYWCRPSCFLEIARCLKTHAMDHKFWGIFRSRLEGRDTLTDITRLAFGLASVLFAAPIPKGFHLEGAGSRSGALDLWIRSFGIDWCLTTFPGSKLSLFVHREFVQSPRAWREVWRSRMLPVHKPARVAEPRTPDLMSSWRTRLQQWRFVMGRLWHHAAGLASYLWYLRTWRRMLRPASAPVNGDLRAIAGNSESSKGRQGNVPTRVPNVDCLSPAKRGPAP